MKELLLPLLRADLTLFQNINGRWTNGVLDQLMPWITDIEKTKWYVIALVLLMFLRRGWKTVFIILGCVLAVGMADASAARLIKPYVKRDRPNQAFHVRLLVPPASGESFPSNHAANVFAGARFLSYYIPEMSLLFGLIALLVSYSRIYVGVHFPLDVFGGAVLGYLCAVFAHWICSEIVLAWRRFRLPDAPHQIQMQAIKNRKKRRRERS